MVMDEIKEICENIELYRMNSPVMDVYRCKEPVNCDKAVSFSDVYVCLKAHELVDLVVQEEEFSN